MVLESEVHTAVLLPECSLQARTGAAVVPELSTLPTLACLPSIQNGWNQHWLPWGFGVPDVQMSRDLLPSRSAQLSSFTLFCFMARKLCKWLPK